ncbi:MAG TPA: cation transporter [Bacteroidales bacterium]|nr:cation transporter [Bacteroidales bacterium]
MAINHPDTHPAQETEPRHRNRNLALTTGLNLLITIAELVGGILSGSLALISDALHNAGDTIAVALSFLALRIGNKKADERRTFGYKRIEILTALLNASLLIAISVFLIIEAIDRFIKPTPVEGGLMLVVALIGLIANLVGVMLLHPHSHGSINIKAAWLHLIGDTVSSVAVVVGGIAIMWLNVIWIDPVITIGVALYLVKESWNIVYETTNILMQGAPRDFPFDNLIREATSIEGISDIHHIHLWNLDDQTLHFEAHICLSQDMSLSEADRIRGLLEGRLKEMFHIGHVTLQTEYHGCRPTNIQHHTNP